MKETAIQRAILDWLSWNKVFAWRENNISIPVHGVQGMQFRRGDPHRRGIPDILACLHGRFIGIEVKTEKGRQSEAQENWQKQLEAAGGIYILARSIDDVERVLKPILHPSKEAPVA